MEDTFHWADYLIFVLSLVISAAIGIFYAWKDRRKHDPAEFLLGGRKMSTLPVTLSLMASFLSAILVLGVPTEIFYHGTMYWLISFSNLITFPVAVHAFLPVFYRLNISSAYEYLERRYCMAVRVMGCIVFQLQMDVRGVLYWPSPKWSNHQYGRGVYFNLLNSRELVKSILLLYMAVVLYAPALAVNQVMGISMYVSILVIGLVCTFYTAIGGLKAVMWTDTFQMIVVFAGLLALVIKGTVEVGGFNYVWDTARNASKLQINNFDPDPLVRHTFWTLVIGGFVTSMTLYAATRALYWQLPASIILTTMLVYLGLVLHAKYHTVDIDTLVDRHDQLIPKMVMDLLGQYHGLPGLMVSCIFSASLSTVSSGVNALALVMLTDIIKPLYRKITLRDMHEVKATIYSKIIALMYGFLTIGLAFVAGEMGNLILQIALSIFGMFGGPLLGLFVIALFFPVTNSWGAGTGLVCSLGFTMFLSIGSIVNRDSVGSSEGIQTTMSSNMSNYTTLIDDLRVNFTTMPTTLTDVTNSTMAASMVTSNFTFLETTPKTISGIDKLYKLSYLWYSSVAVLTCIIVGVVVSCLTGGTRKKPVDEILLSPLYLSIRSLATTQTLNEDDEDEGCQGNGQVTQHINEAMEMEVTVRKDKEE